MKLPKIKEGEVILIRIQKSSGIVVNHDHTLYLDEGNDYYKVFENLDSARLFMESERKECPFVIEGIVFNHSKDIIGVI